MVVPSRPMIILPPSEFMEGVADLFERVTGCRELHEELIPIESFDAVSDLAYESGTLAAPAYPVPRAYFASILPWGTTTLELTADIMNGIAELFGPELWYLGLAEQPQFRELRFLQLGVRLENIRWRDHLKGASV